MAEFRTDYKDQLLDSSVNTKRKYDLVDGTGKVVVENVTFEDKTVYTQDGDTFGAAEVNKIHSELNGLNESLGGIQFNVTDNKPQWREVGADTWNFFSSGKLTLIESNSVYHDLQTYGSYTLLDKNIIIEDYGKYILSVLIGTNTKTNKSEDIVVYQNADLKTHFFENGNHNTFAHQRLYEIECVSSDELNINCSIINNGKFTVYYNLFKVE